MKITNTFRKVTIGTSYVEIKRTEGGVVHILGEDANSIYKGLGFVHAHERLAQILLTRIVASGKISQHFFDNGETFAIDSLMKKMVFQQEASREIENLSDDAKRWCSSYCEGMNAYMSRFGLPMICKIFKVPLEPWRLEDIVTLIKMHMYLGLAQAQERVERFIIQSIHDGVSVEQLKKIFSPHLEKIDKETIQLIKKMHLQRPYLNKQIQFEPAFSNNWAVSGLKTQSGKPLCAHDPHLQVNRLPAFWYEVILQKGDDYHVGITIPGFPGILMGRTKNLSASFTYGMMDGVDFFIEEIKDNHFRREDGWKPLTVREEVVTRKKNGRTILKFFETDAGVLERRENENSVLEDGLHLSLGWSCARDGAAPIINAFTRLWEADSVFAAGKIAREMTLSCNWIFADQENNIAYQQSGRLPKRKHTTLFPLPAWKKENLWNGFVSGKDLSSSYNPSCGFVASANDDKNLPDQPLSIIIPYASYRIDYITRYLSEEKLFTVEDMQALQCDIYSPQAEKFMEQIRDFIPKTPVGEILRNWDCLYSKQSKGATLFEAFYAALLKEVFGRVFGHAAWKEVTTRHSLLIFTHGHFDRVLLSDDESWYGEEGKTACFKRLLDETLQQFTKNIPIWGKKNRFTMNNILFNGKLPRFLGFDVGPIEMEGGRATVATSFVFHERKRVLAAAATYRSVTDLATDEVYTILAGGPNENRYSSYYASDIKKWLNFQYKKLKLEIDKA